MELCTVQLPLQLFKASVMLLKLDSLSDPAATPTLSLLSAALNDTPESAVCIPGQPARGHDLGLLWK